MNKKLINSLQKIAKKIISETQVKQTRKIIEEIRRLMKKYRAFKTKENNPKSRVEFAELRKKI